VPYWYSDRGWTRLRASDADRDRVAAQLKEHCAVGRLTIDELSDRLDQTFAARTLGELNLITQDLPDLDSHPSLRPRSVASVRRPRLRVGRAILLIFLVWVMLRVLVVTTPPALGFGWLFVVCAFLCTRYLLAPRRLSRHGR
jgi:hypothetical protein